MLLRTKVMLIMLFLIALATAFVLRKSGMATGSKELDRQQLAQQTQLQNKEATGMKDPLSRAGERITKKPFGIYVSPKESPVQGERFTGFHTGADFEVFPEELNQNVVVHALCNGTIKQKKWASGYGGALVTTCAIDNQPVTVVYGHLKLDSIKQNIGVEVKAGDDIGILAADKSRDADNERKHLHLGIHKGQAIDIRGYVSNKSDLQNWLDPQKYVQ